MPFQPTIPAPPRRRRLARVLAASVAIATALPLAAAPGAALAGAQVIGGSEMSLDVEIGKGRLIRLDRPAATVFVADPRIADVQVKSPTLVYLVGKAAGGTSLIAVDSAEKMVVNMSVSVGLDGPRLQEALRRQAPDSDVQVTVLNGAAVLSGKVASAQEGEEILRLAAGFLGGGDGKAAPNLINRLTVEAPTQVNLRVRVAEVSRDASRQLGFNWESLGQIGSGVLGVATGADIIDDAGKIIRPAGNEAALIGGVHTDSANINVLVDALEKKNLVSILAEPNLTALSGEPASFLAGGEYPIPVPQGLDQTTIEYKKYGVSLSFVATVLDGGRINLKVRPEVSQLSSAGAVTVNGISVPALTTRRAETTVDLGSGQSFAIAGLLQNTSTRDLQKLPGLGDAPVIGALFRSKRFQNNQSELVIIVTPYLVKPVSQKLATPADLLNGRPAKTASAKTDSAKTGTVQAEAAPAKAPAADPLPPPKP